MFIDVAPRKALLAPDGIFSSHNQHSICMPLPKATMKYCIGLHFYAAPVILRLVAGKRFTALRASRVPIAATFSQTAILCSLEML